VSSAVFPERVRAAGDALALCAEPGIVPPSSTDAAPIRVIYIAGYGRSGTTLLDIALGEHPAVMGGGEISTLARHVWSNDEYCACGARVRSCPMWRGIVEAWSAGEEPTLIDDFRRAQERTETILGIGRLLERWRSGRHASRTARLYEAIAARSGCTVVVDSSKLPGRAFALAAISEIELTVVHVVRDARGVAWSLKKGFKRQADVGLQRELLPKPLLYTALRWMIVNLATERLCRRAGRGRSMRIRYEDFVANPRETVRRILMLVEPDMAAQPPAVASGPMSPKHQVAGSRHRMQPQIVVAHDERWKETMPHLQQWLVTLLCAPLLWRYGYPLKSSTLTGREA
jgi:hypothetical protein